MHTICVLCAASKTHREELDFMLFLLDVSRRPCKLTKFSLIFLYRLVGTMSYCGMTHVCVAMHLTLSRKLGDKRVVTLY